MAQDTTQPEDPRDAHRQQGFPAQEQQQPGSTTETTPKPDHGEDTYVGHGRLEGLVALITGGDSGIGRAVAIAYAREGADVAITHLPEEADDARATTEWVERAGRRSLALAGDLRDPDFCGDAVASTLAELGRLDVLVLGAAYQRDREDFADIPTEEIDRVLRTNLDGVLHTAQAAIPHLQAGASIITTSSIQAFQPAPKLIDYAMTKAAQVAFTQALAEQLGPKGIRVNAVAPGPIWTPLIPATGWPDALESFGKDTPLGRAGQPAELASTYVYLADPASSYVSGAVVAVTGGKHL